MLIETIYNEIKKQYPNSILGFQLGNEVVFIGQDAKKVQWITNTLTRKFIDNGDTIVNMTSLSIEEAEKIPDIKILKGGNNNENS